MYTGYWPCRISKDGNNNLRPDYFKPYSNRMQSCTGIHQLLKDEMKCIEVTAMMILELLIVLNDEGGTLSSIAG